MKIHTRMLTVNENTLSINASCNIFISDIPFFFLHRLIRFRKLFRLATEFHLAT